MAAVAPATPAIAGIFDPESELLLFENGSSAALRRQLTRLVEDRGLARRLAAALQARVLERHNAAAARQFYLTLLAGL